MGFSAAFCRWLLELSIVRQCSVVNGHRGNFTIGSSRAYNIIIFSLNCGHRVIFTLSTSSQIATTVNYLSAGINLPASHPFCDSTAVKVRKLHRQVALSTTSSAVIRPWRLKLRTSCGTASCPSSTQCLLQTWRVALRQSYNAR